MVDKQTLEQTRSTDIVIFLEKRYGFTFAHRRGAYRCKQHPSLAIKDDCLSFYWHSKRIGGFGVLDYLMKVENMPFREAVEAATGIMPTTAPPRHETQQPKTLILPQKTGIALRLYEYLCQKRGIDSSIINTLIQEGKLYEDRRGNIVFVGFDEHGKARFASLRGTYGDCRFRMDCAGSDKRYGFNIAFSPSESLYIYESPIDAMSHANLANAVTGDKNAWKAHNRLSLAGTTDAAIPFLLNQRSLIKELVFCLDNDPAGREATANMVRKYAEKGFVTRIELPMGKDFNEDLIQSNRDKSSQKHTNSLRYDAII